MSSYKPFLQVYVELMNDNEYMTNLAHDMLSAEGIENPTPFLVADTKRGAIRSGYLMDLAKEHYNAQFE